MFFIKKWNKIIFLRVNSTYVTPYNLTTYEKYFLVNISQKNKLKEKSQQPFIDLIYKNYWKKIYTKNNLFQIILKDTKWRIELLLQFRTINTHIILHNIRVPQRIYKKHREHIIRYNYLQQKKAGKIVISLQTGRVGFRKNQKKSFIASSTVISTIFWILNRHKYLFFPIKLRFIGRYFKIQDHYKQIWSYFNKFQINSSIVYTFESAIPLIVRIQRCIRLGRSRRRTHTFNLSSTILDIITEEVTFDDEIISAIETYQFEDYPFYL